jgi:hypothetical protein
MRAAAKIRVQHQPVICEFSYERLGISLLDASLSEETRNKDGPDANKKNQADART